MTGFGSFTHDGESIKVSVEIKSLNSKFLELNLKLPKNYNDQEIFIRNECSRLIERGKASVAISIERKNSTVQSVVINKELAAAYYSQLTQLATSLQADTALLLNEVLKMPDVISSKEEVADEQEWESVLTAFKQAFNNFDTFRLDEGKALATDLRLRIVGILGLLDKVSVEEPKRVPQIKDRLNQLLADAVGAENVDTNRLEQELIYYVEKYDITEEKVRLKTHCDYFLEVMDATAASNGKKLAFITQEIGREINTLGAKANAVTIQQYVVSMKDELEKMKEQLNNVL